MHWDKPTFPEPPLQPGQEGWWKVWGARPLNLRAGDRLVTLEDGELVETNVAATEHRTVMVAITTDTGEKTFIGMANPQAAIFRWGTHHTLA